MARTFERYAGKKNNENVLEKYIRPQIIQK